MTRTPIQTADLLQDAENALVAAYGGAPVGQTKSRPLQTADLLQDETGAIVMRIPGGLPGGEGLDADFSITNFTRNEPLEEAITASVTAKPTYSTRAPAWVEAGGGI